MTFFGILSHISPVKNKKRLKIFGQNQEIPAIVKR